ncbi:ribosome silencing factor [Calidifontibacter indicus]|uniref:Ribosomal silencing factor RsfS n=1 Tax=Calidifontibacter indicus TaxID=419650 RepID=A0A3D9URY2_9MICO|nr:ribosome silencing factor [Calidifontibacter indicus]REF30760.1 ribosome-associated protein [Calidifontibacter indicus]
MTATTESIELAKAAAHAADELKATTVIALDVSEHLALTDIFVIASADNERQVNAIVDSVEDALLERGVKPKRREGRGDGRWVLVDFGDIVVHVQHDDEREFYQLERLWRDCPTVDLELPAGESDDSDAESDDESGRESDTESGTESDTE